MLKVTPHEVGALACDPDFHCYSCGLDELDFAAVICCLECGHVYRRARHLRAAYVRGNWRQFRNELRRPLMPPPALLVAGDVDNPFGGPITRWDRHPRLTAAWRVVLALVTPADEIVFCPLCLHDL